MVRNLLFLFTLLFLFSCTEKENDDPYVRVNTSGIYRPVAVTYQGSEVPDQLNLGEWVTASSPIFIPFTIQNNTNYPVTNIDFSFPGQTNNVYNYSLGDAEEGKFPGFGGTCQRTLAAHKSCTIILQFFTGKSGEYIQEGLLTYKNLVESSSRNVTFSVVAGLPASLIFDDGTSRSFIFGTPIGTAKMPVLERADRIEYHRKLTIKNAGELSARDINIDKIPLCYSYYSPAPDCPIAYFDPWRVEHNCPRTLAPLQECTADMYFIPLNQDPESGFDPVLEELNYKGDIKIDYKRTPEVTSETSLTGRFETNSITIQAKFMSPKTAIAYPGQVISGNYKVDMFNIRNSGSREGELRKLIFRKKAGSLPNPALEAVECRYDDLAGRISCYEEGEDLALELKDFPFVVMDKNNCLSDYQAEKRFVEIEESCVFELRFQPSTTYIAPYIFEYELFVEFDARWKGFETLKEVKLFGILANSVQPALVELFKVEFDGGDKTFTQNGEDLSILGIDNKIDLGRLPLLSPGYEAWRRITFTYRNIGGIPFSFMKAFVGHENGHNGIVEIPKSTNSIELPHHGYRYYKDIQIDTTNCGSGGSVTPDIDRVGNIPTTFCKVTLLFSPTGLSDEDKENELMYDLIEGFTKMWRVFSFHYHDGSYYSDTNFTTNPDLETSNNEALKSTSLALTAELVTSGFLQDYFVAGGFDSIIRGNVKYKEFIFRNIGTGPISYMPYRGERLPHESDTMYDLGFRRMTVSDPSSYGANYDCNDVFDFEARTSDTWIDVLTRLPSFTKLGPLQTCVLRVEAREALQFLDGSGSGGHRLLTLPSNKYYNNDILNHMIRIARGANAGRIVKVDYYDGDASGQPITANEMERNLGGVVKTEAPGSHLKQPINIGANFREQMRMVVVNPTPYQSAVIYVPSSTYPSFEFQNNQGETNTRAGVNRAEIYFAYENRQTNSVSTCNPEPYMHPSCLSPGYANSTKLSALSGLDYDYIIHAGTFNTGRSVPISFSIVNAGNFVGALDKPSESYSDASSGFTTTSSYIAGRTYGQSSNTSSYGTISGGYPINLTFKADNPGVYEWVYSISYYNGRPETDPDKTSTLNIKVVAEAVNDFPEVAFETQDFQVNTIPNNPPEVLLAPTSNGEIASGFNHNASPTKVLIESVKLKTRTAEASFGQKRIIIKNSSSLHSMTNIRYLFKDTAGAVANTTRISWSSSGNHAAKVVADTCTGSSSLAPLASCYIDIKYQPLDIDLTSNFMLSVSYNSDEIAPYQYIQKNLSIELIPRAPSIVRVEGSVEQNVNYRRRGEGPTVYTGKAFNALFSDQLTDGFIIYDEPDKVIEFTYTLKNHTEDSKASLLKQYEVHRGLLSTNRGPDDVSYEADGFVDIYSHSGGSSGASVLVRANKVCLFGGTDIPVGTLNEERGFNTNTNGDCQLKINYSPGINSIGREYSFADIDDVSELYIPIKYYNNKRSSFDEFLITFSGKVYPDKSSISSTEESVYYDVETNHDGYISFSWIPFAPNNPEVGSIVGYRVFYSRYMSHYGDELYMLSPASNPDYVDVRGTNTVEIWGEPIPGVYAIYVAAIRYNPTYTKNTYTGLGTGEFLSHAPGAEILPTRMVVPPDYLQYSYERNMLITYDILGSGAAYPRCNNTGVCGGEFYDYFGAINACKGLSPVALAQEGQPKPYSFSLVTESAWDFIASDFAVTSDRPDLASLNPHWLQTGLIYDIDEVFTAAMGDAYNPVFDNATYDAPYYMNYMKTPSDMCAVVGTCKVPKLAGMLGATVPGYVSYINPTIPLSHARCYVPLD